MIQQWQRKMLPGGVQKRHALGHPSIVGSVLTTPSPFPWTTHCINGNDNLVPKTTHHYKLYLCRRTWVSIETPIPWFSLDQACRTMGKGLFRGLHREDFLTWSSPYLRELVWHRTSELTICKIFIKTVYLSHYPLYTLKLFCSWLIFHEYTGRYYHQIKLAITHETNDNYLKGCHNYRWSRRGIL